MTIHKIEQDPKLGQIYYVRVELSDDAFGISTFIPAIAETLAASGHTWVYLISDPSRTIFAVTHVWNREVE